MTLGKLLNLFSPEKRFLNNSNPTVCDPYGQVILDTGFTWIRFWTISLSLCILILKIKNPWSLFQHNIPVAGLAQWITSRFRALPFTQVVVIDHDNLWAALPITTLHLLVWIPEYYFPISYLILCQLDLVFNCCLGPHIDNCFRELWPDTMKHVDYQLACQYSQIPILSQWLYSRLILFPSLVLAGHIQRRQIYNFAFYYTIAARNC